MSIILSAAFCFALVIKLMFFSYDHRKQSTLFWRAVLFGVTVYSANVFIGYLYYPTQVVRWEETMFHGVLFIGSFLIHPCDLPGNKPHAPTSAPKHHQHTSPTHRLR